MPDPTQLGQAGLQGWRKAVADRVAPPAAAKAPISEDQIRAAIGALFFVLSVLYVVRTIQELVKQQKG
jgi:hypothetical protein